MILLFLYFFLFVVYFLFVIMTIAFSTLFERHILGLSQLRLGPNKVFFLGVLQALFDGLKLLQKEQIYVDKINMSMFIMLPMMLFFHMLVNWLILPELFFYVNFEFQLLFFLCLLGLSVYLSLLMGVFSFSKYSYIGAVRICNQSISFEICFSFFFIFLFLFFNCLNMSFYFSFFFYLFLIVMLILVLTEINRAPFDLAEGESELVSGFNTEYSSLLFVFIFLSEYGMLLFFCCLLMFLLDFFFLLFFIIFLILLIRSCYPRIRYDNLMFLYWKKMLPLILCLFYFYFFFI